MAKINWTNVTDFQGVFQQANTATDGGFWTASIFMIWIVLVITMSRFGILKSLLASSGVMILVSIFAVMFGLVNMIVTGVFIGVAIITIFIIMVTNTD